METFSALLALCAGNSTVNSQHKGQWRGVLMFSLSCVWTNGWVDNRDAGDLRCHCTHYDVTVRKEPEMQRLKDYANLMERFDNSHKTVVCLEYETDETVCRLRGTSNLTNKLRCVETAPWTELPILPSAKLEGTPTESPIKSIAALRWVDGAFMRLRNMVSQFG